MLLKEVDMRSIVLCSLFAFALGAASAQAADKPAKAEKAADKAEKAADKAEKSADKAEKSADKAEKAAAKADKKAGAEVTLSGDMMCAKCELKEAPKCQNVLKVTEAGKETKYYLAQNEVAKSNHEHVCSAPEKATVKGVVSEEGGKKILTASQIKFAK
jgi:hypothetical protein